MTYGMGDVVILSRGIQSDGIYEFVNYANDSEFSYVTNDLASTDIKVQTKYLKLVCRWAERADQGGEQR